MTWPTDRGGARRLGSTRERVENLDGFAEAWQEDRGGAVTDLVADGGRVYAAYEGGALHAFDAGSGDRVWSVVHDADGARVCTDGDRVYLRADDLLALDSADGSLLWRRSPDGEQTRSPRMAGNGSPVVAEGSLLRSDDGSLMALDPATGDERWRVAFDDVPTVPAAADGLVVVVTQWDASPDFIPEPMPSGTVHALDADTGTVRWETDLDGGPVGAPAVGDGRVHVAHADNPSASMDGFGLTTLDAATGGERWSDFCDRVLGAVDRIASEHAEDAVLIAAHGGVNKAVLSRVKFADTGQRSRIEQDTACLNELRYRPGRSEIRRINDTSHLRDGE
jgi:outer membrane protein assembly factor BamB